MIHSVSTYLKTTIGKYLSDFLSSSYILNEDILNDFPKDVRTAFIHKFCTDGKHIGSPIDIRFVYKPSKMDNNATILIQEEGGKEETNTDQALGMNLGSTKSPQGDHVLTEYSHLYYDSKLDRAYYQVKHPIYKVTGINRYAGHYKIKGNRIYLLGTYSALVAKTNDNPREKAVINYISTTSVSKRTYQLIGYDAIEDYTIDIISDNVDIIRCLTALMKAVFITMRCQAVQENTKYYLPKISEQGVDQVAALNDPKHSTSGNQIFFHRFNLNYKISYTLPEKFGLYVNRAITTPKFNFGVKVPHKTPSNS